MDNSIHVQPQTRDDRPAGAEFGAVTVVQRPPECFGSLREGDAARARNRLAEDDPQVLAATKSAWRELIVKYAPAASPGCSDHKFGAVAFSRLGQSITPAQNKAHHTSTGCINNLGP
jgi:hypothetical protein